MSTKDTAPVVVAQRLRKGSCGSPRGAKRLVADALKTIRTMSDDKPLVRADSAFFGHPTIAAALKAGADVSVTVRLDNRIKTAISSIPEDGWTPIEYTDAVYDEQANRWVSRAEVAEIEFTAFAAQKKTNHVPGRLVVRRIPDLNPAKTARRRCSTPGASTRSSPPPTRTRPTPWPRTRPTAATRSSSRSTPT